MTKEIVENAGVVQQDYNEKGSHKGPPLKREGNHKLVHYIEQKLLGEPIEGEETTTIVME